MAISGYITQLCKNKPCNNYTQHKTGTCTECRKCECKNCQAVFVLKDYADTSARSKYKTFCANCRNKPTILRKFGYLD